MPKRRGKLHPELQSVVMETENFEVEVLRISSVHGNYYNVPPVFHSLGYRESLALQILF